MLFKTILNGLYFSGLQALCSPVTGGMGAILALHRVCEEKELEFAPNAHLSITPEFLDEVIYHLKQLGYRLVSLDEAERLIHKGSQQSDGEPFIAITLDDGYRDNLENAVPIFAKHVVPYTIFVAPGMIDGEHPIWWEDLENIISSQSRVIVDLPEERSEFLTRSANEKNAAFDSLMNILGEKVSEAQQREIVSNLGDAYSYDSCAYVKSQLMGWEEIRDLSTDPLCSIGAHTMGHFALARLSEEACREEMISSRNQLEKQLDCEVSHFAYPYGFPVAAGPREFRIARELGFKTAVTTRHGVIYPEHNSHITALPRISLNGLYQAKHYVSTLLSGVPTRLNNFGSKLNVA